MGQVQRLYKTINWKLDTEFVIMLQVYIQSQRSRTALCESYVTGMGSTDLLLLLTGMCKHYVQGLDCCQAAIFKHTGGVWENNQQK